MSGGQPRPDAGRRWNFQAVKSEDRVGLRVFVLLTVLVVSMAVLSCTESEQSTVDASSQMVAPPRAAEPDRKSEDVDDVAGIKSDPRWARAGVATEIATRRAPTETERPEAQLTPTPAILVGERAPLATLPVATASLARSEGTPELQVTPTVAVRAGAGVEMAIPPVTTSNPARSEVTPQIQLTPTAAGEAGESPSPATTPVAAATRVPTREVSAHHGGTPCHPVPYANWLADLSFVTSMVEWTPDGSAIVFTHGPEVYTASADGTWVSKVADGSAPHPWFVVPHPFEFGRRIGWMTAVDISSDGTQIVYSTCKYPFSRSLPKESGDPRSANGGDASISAYGYELALESLDGEQGQRLTSSTNYENYPAWSPNGKAIAFVASNPVDDIRPWWVFLHTMNPEGSERRRIAAHIPIFPRHRPAWSPDSQRIAFSSAGERNKGLYVVDADGYNLQRLAVTVSWPSWSPDGQSIAYAQPDGEDVALFTIGADGSDARRLVTIDGWQQRQYGEPDPQEAWIRDVAWSPAGDMILYACRAGICVVGVDGSPVGHSPTDRRAAIAAAWSPDGSLIAVVDGFAYDDMNRGDSYLYTMAPDGTNSKTLVRVGIGLLAAQSGYEDVEASATACSEGYVVAQPAQHPGLIQDCETLIALRSELFVRFPSNWGPGTPIDRWAGVVVGGSPRRVRQLRLPKRELRGRLPAKLGGLTHLEHLDLSRNEFDGPIPPTLGQLALLRVLNLSLNSHSYTYIGLSGDIPPELGLLTELRVLNLSRNDLSGGIPPRLGQLENLVELDLSENDLTGTIPSELGALKWLERLRLYGNELSGSLPSALGQLMSLTELDLGRNELTGVIPAAIGRLSNLTRLSLGSNEFTGTIPTEIGQLSKLTEADLAYNNLTGSIPPDIGRLENLGYLRLSGNGLVGAIPAALGSLTMLTHLNLGRNQLTGEIPAELGRLVNLQRLGLFENQLTGSIPAQLAQLVNLNQLNLGGNELAGCIPQPLSRVARNSSYPVEMPVCE